jgi:hypothetical protein
MSCLGETGTKGAADSANTYDRDSHEAEATETLASAASMDRIRYLPAAIGLLTQIGRTESASRWTGGN